QDRLEELLESAEGWERLRDGFRPLRNFIAEGVQLMWAVKPELARLEGKFFGEIADEMKLDPVEAYLTIARESGTRARVLNHLYSGDDDREESALRAAMSHPLNAFEMDTILTSHGHQNPASFGTYPRILGYYVRDRGLLREGYAADVCIFDPARIGCAADSKSPNRDPVGIEYVLVNGHPVIRKGEWRGDGVTAGQWLARG